MHPHAPRPLSQAESDALTSTNLRVLVRQLEQRVRVQRDRITELEMLVGHEKRELEEEVKRVRQALTDLQRQC